jgi:sirohydrochlorin cobaltochelatase
MNVKETLLLVGHGSKMPHSKELLVDLAEKIRARGLFENVDIGVMDFDEPTIPQSIKKAIDGGSKRIIVVPVFFFLLIHTTQDIPRILGLLNDEECTHDHDHKHDTNSHAGEHDNCHSDDHGHDHNHSFSGKILKILKPAGKHDHSHNHNHDKNHDNNHDQNHDQNHSRGLGSNQNQSREDALRFHIKPQ